MEINRESVKPKLVRCAHNWNDGTMDYWNMGSFLHRMKKIWFMR